MNREIRTPAAESDTPSRSIPSEDTQGLDNGSWPMDEEPHSRYIPRVRATIEAFGLLSIPESIVARQAMLGIPNPHGESFLGHSDTVGAMTHELIEGLNSWGETTRVRSRIRDQVVTAAHFHDIGKTGPAGIINPHPEIFVKFFNVNYPLGTQESHLHTALDYGVHHGQLTEADRNYIKQVLRKNGHDPDKMTLRAFYNLHSLYTYDILREAGVEEAVAAAASGHHLKRDIKPDHYSARDLAETGRYIEPMDEWAAMTRTGNPKSGAPLADRIKAVLNPFASMTRDHVIGEPYCEVIQNSIRSGVLPKILEKHQRQIH